MCVRSKIDNPGEKSNQTHNAKAKGTFFTPARQGPRLIPTQENLGKEPARISQADYTELGYLRSGYTATVHLDLKVGPAQLVPVNPYLKGTMLSK